MYGWDTYFIQVGLLRDGEVEPAKDMADNFVYEIRNFGKILNANRSYYLNPDPSRHFSQRCYWVYIAARTIENGWEDALPAVEQYYRYWTRAPHLTADTNEPLLRSWRRSRA